MADARILGDQPIEGGPGQYGNMSPWSGPPTLAPEGVAVDKDGIVYTSQGLPCGLNRWMKNIDTRFGGGD